MNNDMNILVFLCIFLFLTLLIFQVIFSLEEGNAEKPDDKYNSGQMDTEYMNSSHFVKLNEEQDRFNASSTSNSNSSSSNSGGSSPSKHKLFSWSKRRKNSSENVNEKVAEIDNCVTV